MEALRDYHDLLPGLLVLPTHFHPLCTSEDGDDTGEMKTGSQTDRQVYRQTGLQTFAAQVT